jgi:membrane fusion protein (multidrug efflux system)
MKPALKKTLWCLTVVVIAAGVIAPKVVPRSSDLAAEKPSAARMPQQVLAVATYVVQPAPFAEKLRATLSRAQYRKQLAVLREKRIAQLLKQGVARQEEYDTALAELNVQDADIELTRAQIAKTEIRAPFDGIVGLRYVSDGAFITANTRVATLQRLDRLKIDFSLPEKYAGRIKPGSPVTFSVPGGEQRFKGEIYARDPRIDATTRTVLVRAWCENPGARLLPGASASVELVLSELGDAILVPSVAVMPGLDEFSVYVVGPGHKAERRAVEAGTRLESTVHILSGLRKGDVVITSGLQQLRPGQMVEIRAD